MDSVSQFALGAALGVAVMGRRTAVWKAALWGGLAGTIPDLDAFIDHGDAVRNMTFHRADSHGLFWLTLGAPVLAWIASRLGGGGQALFKRWWLALWLALFTHPLLDTMTVYGTQLLQPFSDHPFGLGSIFIIDPLYTVPLLVGLGVALARREGRGLRWNHWGLGLSCAYLAWTVAAQAHVRSIAQDSLAAAQVPADAPMLVTPTAFNTVLWRVVVMRGDHYLEGFHSLLDAEPKVRFQRLPRDVALERELEPLWAVRRMAWFSRGFYRLHDEDGQAYLTDLRMGQEPNYVFSFRVAQRGSGWHELTPVNLGLRGDVKKGLAWTWERMLGHEVAPLD